LIAEAKANALAETTPDALAKATRTAIAETLAYLGDHDTAWDPQTLRQWADDTANQPATYACCPFCSEVECDDNCPMRQVRNI